MFIETKYSGFLPDGNPGIYLFFLIRNGIGLVTHRGLFGGIPGIIWWHLPEDWANGQDVFSYYEHLRNQGQSGTKAARKRNKLHKLHTIKKASTPKTPNHKKGG